MSEKCHLKRKIKCRRQTPRNRTTFSTNAKTQTESTIKLSAIWAVGRRCVAMFVHNKRNRKWNELRSPKALARRGFCACVVAVVYVLHIFPPWHRHETCFVQTPAEEEFENDLRQFWESLQAVCKDNFIEIFPRRKLFKFSFLHLLTR